MSMLEGLEKESIESHGWSVAFTLLCSRRGTSTKKEEGTLVETAVEENRISGDVNGR